MKKVKELLKLIDKNKFDKFVSTAEKHKIEFQGYYNKKFVFMEDFWKSSVHSYHEANDFFFIYSLYHSKNIFVEHLFHKCQDAIFKAFFERLNKSQINHHSEEKIEYLIKLCLTKGNNDIKSYVLEHLICYCKDISKYEDLLINNSFDEIIFNTKFSRKLKNISYFIKDINYSNGNHSFASMKMTENCMKQLFDREIEVKSSDLLKQWIVYQNYDNVKALIDYGCLLSTDRYDINMNHHIDNVKIYDLISSMENFHDFLNNNKHVLLKISSYEIMDRILLDLI